MDEEKKKLREILLEHIDIAPSDIVEEAILAISKIIADATVATRRYDEAKMLNEFSGAFCYAGGMLW